MSKPPVRLPNPVALPRAVPIQQPASTYSSRSPEHEAVKQAYTDNDRDRAEQYLPMMPLERSISQQQQIYADDKIIQKDVITTNKKGDMDAPAKLPRPTGLFTWIGFAFMLLALASLCISFSSPFWIQAYPNSFNEFRNIGLWEVCFDNYMHYRDQAQDHFTGCYWVFNPVIFTKLKEWLLPPWFIAVQVLVTGCLLLNIASIIITTLVFLHVCPIISHEYYQTYALFITSALLFLYSSTIVTSAFIFGMMCQDWEWMPRPDLNIISWGYGCLIIAGLFGTAAACCLYYESTKVYSELLSREDNYAKQMLDLEIDAFLETNAQQRYDASLASESFGGTISGYHRGNMITADSQPQIEKPPLNSSLDRTDNSTSFDQAPMQAPVALERAMPIPPHQTQHVPPQGSKMLPPPQKYQPRPAQPLQPYQPSQSYRPPLQSNFQPLPYNFQPPTPAFRPQNPPKYSKNI